LRLKNKIEIARKKAERVLEDQRKMFEIKEKKADEQRRKFEAQRLALQDELHKKGLEK